MRRLIVLLGLALGLTGASFADVTNGGFETGDTTGWTVTGADSQSKVSNGAFLEFHAFDGNYSYFVTSPSDPMLSQDIVTIPSQDYVIEFWLANLDTTNTNVFSVSWDGSEIYSFSNADFFDYTHYEFDVTASSSLTTLAFDFGSPHYFAIDDISVHEPNTNAVPEPASLMLLGSGLLGAAGAVRRRIRS